VPIHASTTTDGIGPCDLVIIATRAFDVEAAAQMVWDDMIGSPMKAA
jgi:ketopantoate reductase